MSQEINAENGTKGIIHGYEDRIKVLEGMLDAALKLSPPDDFLIKELKEELSRQVQERDRGGVGSSTQSQVAQEIAELRAELERLRAPQARDNSSQGGDVLTHVTIKNKVVASLRASNVTCPDNFAIGRMFRYYLTELKAFIDDDNFLLDLYYRAKATPGTITRLVITKETGIALSPSTSEQASMRTSPNLLSASNADGVSVVVKVLSAGDEEMPFSGHQSKFTNEVECAKLFTSITKDAEQKDLRLALVPCNVACIRKGVRTNDGNTRRISVDVLIMDHYDGTLSTIAQLRVPVILRQGLRLRQAVERIHAEGYVHMDIKPNNIFIKQGLWYLGDYGSCRSSARKEVITSSTPGMYPHRLAGKKGPEALRAEPKYDFYMLGLTLVLALNVGRYHPSDLIEDPARFHKKLIETSIAALVKGEEDGGGDEETRRSLVHLIKDLLTLGGCTFNDDGECTFIGYCYNDDWWEIVADEEPIDADEK